MIKKILAFLLTFSMLICLKPQSFAVEIQNNDFINNLTCKSAILMEQDSGKILASKNIDEKLAPASITKIMTMLLIMEALDNGALHLGDKISCSSNAKIMGGSEIWLEVGEEMSLNDILKAIAVASANDCAVAIAEHMAGDELSFVKIMNNRAKQLGMNNTNYMNCHGLDEENHYTTARDIAILTKELMKHDKIKEYSTIWMDTLRNGKTQLVNTNKLIRFYKGATGLKTGTTDNAGHCLAATATRGDLSLIAVTMCSKTTNERFDNTSKLLDYGFATFENVKVPDIDCEIQSTPILGGVATDIKGVANAPKYILTSKKNKNSIKTEIIISKILTAPVEKGQKIGIVKIIIGDTLYGEFPIISNKNIKVRNIFESSIFLWNEFCKMK